MSTLKPLIEKLLARQDLTQDEMHSALDCILQSNNHEQIAAFLVSLRAKGETADELYALVQAVKAHMTPIENDFPLLDIVGTGGDQSNTVNISTASAILAAACGAKVLKHGNRSVSSKCGSADFIESLGVDLELDSVAIASCLKKLGIGFAYAPRFHPSMKKVMPIRRALGIRTIFNFLGPLLNPASPCYFLMGVFSEKYLMLFSHVLQKLSVQHAMVVHSCGLDELSLLGPSTIIEIKNNALKEYTITPQDFGFSSCSLEDIQGGDASTNRQLLLDALSGKPGAIADNIALNTGAALYVANIADSLIEGVELAREHLRLGKAVSLIDAWVSYE